MSYASEVLADSPEVYYKLDEASSGSMIDSSPNARHGSLLATTSGGPTMLQASLLGDGSGSSARFQNSFAFRNFGTWMNASAFTVEARFKATTLSANNPIAAAWTDTTPGLRWILWVSSANKLQGYIYSSAGGTFSVTGATTIATGTTYTAALTYNGTDLKVYLNGVVDGTTSPGVTMSTAGTGVQFEIGAVSGAVTRAQNMLIDEVSFTPTALSGARLAARHAAAIAGGAGGPTTVNGGQATETDTAQAGTRTVGARVTGGQALEVAAALAGVALVGVVVAGGQAVETETALPGSVRTGLAVPGGQAVESDETFAGSVVAGARIAGGQAVESDAALPGSLVSGWAYPGGQAVEFDEVLPGSTFVVIPPQSDTTDASNGLDISGYGVASWSPPVVAPPFPMVVHNFDTAVALSAPEFRADGSVKPLAPTKAHAQRHRPRITVGGKDVTFLRGTPASFSYRLIEPLLYGSGSLDLPQINATWEVYGQGHLKWLDKGKPVRIERVDVETGAVVAEDYRGFISDINVDGASLLIDLAGEVSGRAAMLTKQVPPFRKKNDAGRLWYDMMRFVSTSPVTPKLGPTTGIPLVDFGGTSALDYLSELGAKTVNEDGEQWTTERVNGEWRFRKKNLTTKHFTVYADDARMVLRVASAMSEEPNRIFADGISPTGRRVTFTDYPGLIEGEPAPYPFNNTSHTFGLGTTNEDTDTGDGISVMIHRMLNTGLLDRRDGDGFYDADVRRSVRVLQDQAGLAVTGVMNLSTWRKLYDLDATGYTTTGAIRRPAAQLSRVRPWNLTSSGAIAERNPYFDRSVVPVEHSISVGPGFTPGQIREFAKTKLQPSPNWVGTLTMHLAPIRGEHNYGDPLTSADLMPGREVRPGMNVWVPNFQGGTLFHVSGVEVPADGAVVLTVDTRARDTMEAWQVINRNRESRINPARAWVRQNRSSQTTKDAVQGWDIKAGITEDRHLKAGWNVVEVIGGDEGTVQLIQARLNPAREFAMWVFGRKVTPKWCAARVESPLSKAGTERFDKPAVRKALDDKILLYSAGGFEAECGHFPYPRQNLDGETIAAPLTGKWEDAAGFSYRTFAEPVLYVAIWVPSATVLPKQTLMVEQLETGS